MSSRLRCAIYTRKSSEEGLEQNFNSLHAQREACEAYILSQTGEGWTAIKTAYDDGGYSGGSMERPGLKLLLADIGKGQVDVVVVYKVDRLTRSLADFAKIVEHFDAKGVSFVSVTQAFNTTSSMGRLTLNVLLSFAQFEREVTGERIRDKFAASKAKGLRMGGHPPLGYDIIDGRLAVNADEAPRVQTLFRRYLELGSAKALERVSSKRWVNRAGVEAGGGAMARSAIHYLLRNPAYIGVTRHKDKRYENTHPAIIGRDLWEAVQARLDETIGKRPGTELRGEAASLAGRVFDDRDNPMVAVHTKRGAKRYRYYLSRAKLTGRGVAGSLHRISAGILEGFLTQQLAPRLSPSWLPDAEDAARVAAALTRAVVGNDRIEAHLAVAALRPDAIPAGATEADDDVCILRLAFEMRRRQGALILEAPGFRPGAAPNMDRALIRALALAKAWARELETGEVASIKALARREGLCSHYTSRMLPLAYLAPDLADDILHGRQHRGVSLATLTAQALPPNWDDQRQFVEGLGARCN